MSIKISTRKVLKDGKKCRSILNIQAIRYSELPDIYIEQFPHCFLLDSSDTLIIEVDWATRYVLSVGDRYVEEAYFQECLQYIRESGKHLMRVNNYLWSQEEVVEI